MNFIKVFVSAVVILGGAFLVYACDQKSESVAFKDDLQVVEVMTVSYERVTLHATLNGVVNAYESADIRPQVSGIIREQYFSGGEEVKKDAPLYLIDDRPFKNKYDYALASYHKDLAKFELVGLKLKRYSNLVKTNAVSSQELEDVKAAYAECKAQLEISKSNLANAKLDLEYTKVLSPLTGTVGRSTVTRGALVTANQSASLTSVTDLNKVYVDLQESSSDYQKNLLKIKNGELKLPPDGIKVTLVTDATLSKQQETQVGYLKFYDVRVDESSGNLTLRTLFDNKERLLLPGMNVTARMAVGVMDKALLLPEKALTREARGDIYVYTVENGEAIKKKVSVKALEDGRYLVEEGLTAGEHVIISGRRVLKNHMKVKVQD